MWTGKIKWIAILLSLLLGFEAYPQDENAARKKVEDCINVYKETMSLGKGVSQEMSNTVIAEFKSLFELDASLVWDLYKSDSAKLPPMTMRDYINNAREIYHDQRPLVNLSESRKPKIKIAKDEQNATVYVTKYNLVKISDDKPPVENKIKLKMLMNIKHDQALIQNIVEDTRATRVKSISAYGGYIIWNNLEQDIKNMTASQFGQVTMDDISVETAPQIPAGLSVEFRLNRNKYDGMTIETGLAFSQQKYTIGVTNYNYTYRTTIDAESNNPFVCSVYDSTNSLEETVKNKTFSLPILVKYYVIKDWAYLKAGPFINFSLWDSEVNYVLQHTGGGQMISQAGDEVFIGYDYRFDNEYGFFEDRDVNLSPDLEFKDINVSFLLAVGLEKRFFPFSIALEPAVMFAPSPYTSNTGSEFLIYPESGYKSIIQSLDLSGFSISGMVTLRFSYFF